MKIEPKQIRTITVDGREYTYVVAEGPDDMLLRVYFNKKQLFLSLQLPYPVPWAIELHRPRAVAFIVRHFQPLYVGRPIDLAWHEDPVLFDGLLDLFFSETEQAERAEFLARLPAKPERSKMVCMDKLMVPAGIKGILRRLQSAGHPAYLVGGCVRDALLGRVPEDWDICTAALPEQTMALFDRTVPTGLKHGTVTVFYGGSQAEVTTFRKDGPYTDHRRPDDVRFTDSLTEDLSRRDFTINAMAMDLDGNLIDPFGGQKDLNNKVIRCVGDPDKRFQEDALRMFRMLRFAAQLKFSFDGFDGEALDRNVHLVTFLAPERIRAELEKTLLSPQPFYAMAMAWLELLSAFLSHTPEMGDLPYPEAKAPYRWAWFCAQLMLQNCIESPEVFLRSLRADTATIRFCEQAVPLILAPLPEDAPALRRLIANHGPDAVRCAAQCQNRQDVLSRIDTVLASGACLDLAHLAVNGTDLQALGYTGTDIGKTLHRLLDAVLEDPACNKKEILLNLLKEDPHG